MIAQERASIRAKPVSRKWPTRARDMSEIYLSTDVESDGPIPGPHSMLSFASAAYTPDKKVIGTFAANLESLPGATADPRTMQWWQQHPEAWAAARKTPEDPAAVMPRYVQWVKGLPGKPVFVAYPAGFDFLFVYWYMMRFAGESPFSFSALDIKTYAMAMLRCEYREASKRNMPKRWFDELPHTHQSLDDAMEQGALFCNMLAENQSRE
jgi:hypothetical protein